MTLKHTKIDNYFIISSLNSESAFKLINRIPGLPLLISSLPGSASRMHVEWLGKHRNSTSILQALPSKLDIKRHSPRILYILTDEMRKKDNINITVTCGLYKGTWSLSDIK